MNMNEWEWQLVNYYIEKINNHILERFYPSKRLCVERRFKRWYGLGGAWINLFLLHYLKMDHKTDSGFEIQDTYCVRSMAILKLKFVKGNTADEAAVAANGNAPDGMSTTEQSR